MTTTLPPLYRTAGADESVPGPPPAAGTPAAPVDFSAYCQDLFGTLARSDQRRWGEVYVRGLLDVPGRKTPARISEQVLGRRAVQQIQQFVNQSPWPCGPVRRRLAGQLDQAFATEAWCVDEVVFAKNGDRSVGVARQYAPSLERTVNCQLALATSLVGRHGGVPVSWRLLLPQRWDRDEGLRRQAHLPDGERSRPRWRYILEAVDEMLEEWCLEPLPVLADWRGEGDVAPLLRGLEARGLAYLVEVSPTVAVTLPRPCAGSPQGSGTLLELAVHAAQHRGRTPIAWQDRATARMRQSQVLSMPALLQSEAQPSGAAGRPAESRPAQRPRHLVTDWPYGRPAPRAYWLTNLPARNLPDVLPLAQLRTLSGQSLSRMQRDFGLADFEGRSFRGWHHHVTLASVALGFDALCSPYRSQPTAPKSMSPRPGTP
ncbi:IS701 family transposase [Streptomyces pharetrae]|uniref:IS701 family transposase n=1 Tax=Streptomyces pharetrae TaxID=291370 RepID=UPI001FE59D67|nr:transposase [Streptomyces glaucescens]